MSKPTMNKQETESTITDDDISVLRVLLHNIKGISSVSSANEYVPVESSGDE